MTKNKIDKYAEKFFSHEKVLRTLAGVFSFYLKFKIREKNLKKNQPNQERYLFEKNEVALRKEKEGNLG